MCYELQGEYIELTQCPLLGDEPVKFKRRRRVRKNTKLEDNHRPKSGERRKRHKVSAF